MNYKDPRVKCRITHIGKTNDNLTDRAGLIIISRYIRSLGVPAILAEKFSFIKRSSKGTSLISLFHQLICFFINGEGPSSIDVRSTERRFRIQGDNRSIPEGDALFPFRKKILL